MQNNEHRHKEYAADLRDNEFRQVPGDYQPARNNNNWLTYVIALAILATAVWLVLYITANAAPADDLLAKAKQHVIEMDACFLKDTE